MAKLGHVLRARARRRRRARRLTRALRRAGGVARTLLQKTARACVSAQRSETRVAGARTAALSSRTAASCASTSRCTAQRKAKRCSLSTRKRSARWNLVAGRQTARNRRRATASDARQCAGAQRLALGDKELARYVRAELAEDGGALLDAVGQLERRQLHRRRGRRRRAAACSHHTAQCCRRFGERARVCLALCARAFFADSSRATTPTPTTARRRQRRTHRCNNGEKVARRHRKIARHVPAHRHRPRVRRRTELHPDADASARRAPHAHGVTPT